jgi:2-iminobutanoate/2-iminopropanoate deaminase
VRDVLGAAGATLEDVVSVVVYLANVDDWGKFNDIYKEIFRPPYPSRTAVGASLRGILVEVSAVAFKKQ